MRAMVSFKHQPLQSSYPPTQIYHGRKLSGTCLQKILMRFELSPKTHKLRFPLEAHILTVNMFPLSRLVALNVKPPSQLRARVRTMSKVLAKHSTFEALILNGLQLNYHPQPSSRAVGDTLRSHIEALHPVKMVSTSQLKSPPLGFVATRPRFLILGFELFSLATSRWSSRRQSKAHLSRTWVTLLVLLIVLTK